MFSCMFCDKMFSCFIHLKGHVKLKHSDQLYSENKCNFLNCMKSYSTVYSLLRHICTAHDIELDKGYKEYKKNNKESKLLNESIIKATISQNVNPIEVVDSININAASLPNTLNIRDNFSFENFNSEILNATLSLITRLYSFENLNKKDAQKIIHEIFYTYLSEIFEIFGKKYGATNDICNYLKIIKNNLKKFKTEYHTLKYLTDINCLIKPLAITIHSYLAPRKKKLKKQLVVHHKKFALIPIKLVLKKFLELPNVFTSIVEYMKECQNNTTLLTSIYHGEMWKSIVLEENKIILPIALYFDDFEINNPLGSRKSIHKLGAVYLSLLGLPPQYGSNINNIFLVQLNNYQDHKKFGNKIFSHVIDEIIDLSINGITINVNKEQKIFFRLMYIVGDNLGLNTILGFSKGFNSQYYCRVCTATKKDAQNFVNEKEEYIRTRNDYLNCVINSTFGIQEECIFNKIPNFHVLENLSIDPMHDLLEGICRYDLPKILNNFIYVEKYFTLEIFNERLLHCISSFHENVPLPFNSESIKTEQIIITASEMYYLINNLSLMINDFIPENNLYWQLYLLIKKIVNISCSHFLTSKCIDSFHLVVSKYLTLHKKLFNIALKPKHHFLLHYAKIMKKYGPLMSSFRFEAKHRQLKNYAKVITSRVNSPYTLALKNQLKLCYRFVCAEGFLNCLQHDAKIIKLTDISEYFDIKDALHPELIHNDLNTVSWAIVNGTRYEINNIICTNIYDRSFAKIRHIILNKREIFFLLLKLSTLSFNPHKNAYKISDQNQFFCIKHKDLIDYHVYFESNDNYIFCENFFEL